MYSINNVESYPIAHTVLLIDQNSNNSHTVNQQPQISQYKEYDEKEKVLLIQKHNVRYAPIISVSMFMVIIAGLFMIDYTCKTHLFGHGGANDTLSSNLLFNFNSLCSNLGY
ncbi:hypothetical protein AB837_00509 [bacterium AB1]|nr:hypothetical protein AB837_00509 [bacterium AB1]